MPDRRCAPRLVGAAALLAVVAGGCAERRLVAAPADRPGTGTWVLVWAAGFLTAALAGVLLTLPLWRRPPSDPAERSTPERAEAGRPGLAATVLALQAGVVAVVGVLLAGFAVRSWQLIERPLDREPAQALVRISRIDGDTALFALFVLTIVVLGGLLVALLALAARLAASPDRIDRWIAFGLLAVELLTAGALAGLHVAGFGGWPFRSGLVALPVLVVTLAAAWPRRATS